MRTRGQDHFLPLTLDSYSVTISYVSKATWPIVTRFHIEPSRAEGTENYSNGSRHMTNVPTMPIYGKNLLQNQLSDGLET